jgi:hypothetical protein
LKDYDLGLKDYRCCLIPIINIFTDLTLPHFCACPKSGPRFSSTCQGIFGVSWFGVRGSCLFCWCSQNCWQSLFNPFIILLYMFQCNLFFSLFPENTTPLTWPDLIPNLSWWNIHIKLPQCKHSSYIFTKEINHHHSFNVSDFCRGAVVIVILWFSIIWIYSYIRTQCLSPLTLWVWIPLMVRCTVSQMTMDNHNSIIYSLYPILKLE